MNKIDNFSGDYEFLSNFYFAPITDVVGNLWGSTEQFYQACKTLDTKEWTEIYYSKGPGDAKRLGQKVTLREDWDRIKIDVMYEALCYKFTQHPELMKWLKETGDAYLEEGNTWNDTFWGVCKGKGKNMLGVLLIRV